MRWIWLVIGILAVITGVVWTLQGLNILGGSVMSGRTIFAVIGPIVALIGLALAGVGLWQSRAPTPR
jgi:hypothetical protein